MNANRREVSKGKALCGILRFSTVLLLPFLNSCYSPGGGMPDWLANPKSVYPESEYLVAVGEGDTRRAAENAAAANLSRIFEAHIESDERLLDQVRETNESFERTTDFTSDINILSAQTLYNIQHAEAWTGENGRVHAVAYLNRRETAALYRDKINQQTTLVNYLRAHAVQTHDLLKKYAHLRAAVQHAAEAEYLLRQLRIIHPRSVPGSTPGYTKSKIHRELVETAKQIRVEISISGDDDRRMASVLEELVTRYGFVVGKPAVLQIDGRVAVSDTGQRTAELVFVRYELVLHIKDTTDTLLVSLNEKGREGHVSLAEARVRSFRTLENAIKSKGAHRLDQYFDSLVDPMP